MLVFIPANYLRLSKMYEFTLDHPNDPDPNSQESNGMSNFDKIYLGATAGFIGFCVLTTFWKRCTSGWRNDLNVKRDKNIVRVNWPVSSFNSTNINTAPLLNDFNQPLLINTTSQESSTANVTGLNTENQSKSKTFSDVENITTNQALPAKDAAKMLSFSDPMARRNQALTTQSHDPLTASLLNTAKSHCFYLNNDDQTAQSVQTIQDSAKIAHGGSNKALLNG
jgi:hypothetical protein